MIIISTFGKEVQSIRKSKNLSLKDVAARGGLSHSYLSQIENKRRNPPKPDMIKKIAKGLDENHNDLMKLAGYISETTSLQHETEQLNREAVEVNKKSSNLELQLKHFEALKIQEELIKTIENLSDLYKVLTSDSDLYYKDRLLTKEDKQKLLTVIEALLD